MQILNNQLEIVGRPSLMRPLPTYRELKKDQVIDGWTVPYNMHADWEAIFWFFGLWTSSYGICKNGKKHRSHQRGAVQATMRDPVFVGDFVDDLQVHTASNTFNPRTNLYHVVLEFGVPPKPRKVEQVDFVYLSAIHNNMKRQQEATETLLDDFFIKVIPLIKTVDQKPLDTSAAKALFSTIKSDYNQAINETLKEVRESEWHF